ncbi:MAG: MFS transporter, partial [Roseimicrobium sp.]
MSPAADWNATPELDAAPRLPAANLRSYLAVLAVQALNAFNDNFVKILLVAFAGVVAAGTKLGDEMAANLGIIFSLPYVLFAPMAGWISDRWSKQRVILWMQVVQVLIFVLFLGALWLHDTRLTLYASWGCFFLLATQAAFFSPAKFGIMKELVGSRRLGSASGALQLTTFVGILGGMGLAGAWFGYRLKMGDDPWAAVWWPMVVVTVLSITQVLGSLLIVKTPGHEEVVFRRAVWWEHFSHLSLLFSQRPLRLAALGVMFFWFTSNAVGTVLVKLAHELHPLDAVAASQALSMMPAMLGVGVMLGSVVAGTVCRKRIELGLVPISGFALAGSLLWCGLAPVSPWIYLALIAVGLAAGAFMTPLYAFVQDTAKPSERARILSAMNLLDCVGAITANAIIKELVAWKVSAPLQLLLLVPLTLGAALLITRLLPRSLLRLVVIAFMRAFYRIRAHEPERLPKEGAVLVMPNHVSYADALVLGVSAERDLRFVMFESLYKLRSIQWFLKLFATVPISPTKAKEAIRTVGEALKEQQAVVLYPEGQLTRTGFLNKIQKGYQL